MEIIKKRTRKKDWFCLEIDNGTSTMCLVVGQTTSDTTNMLKKWYVRIGFGSIMLFELYPNDSSLYFKLYFNPSQGYDNHLI